MSSPTIAPAARPVAVDALPPLARRPVFLITGLWLLVVGVACWWYGYFGDELYFLAAADHLAWGYADQQPALPVLAGTMHLLLPDTPFTLRLPALVATAAGVPLAALIAREFGGDRRAQVLTAGAFALCPQILLNGRLLGTMTFDPLLWTVLTWLLVRWVRLRGVGRADDRLLLWAGVVTAVAVQVKFLVLGFWLSCGLAVALVGPRQLLARGKLWLGAGIAVVTTVPTLLWQATHGWPQLGMSGVVNSESRYEGLALLSRWVMLAGVVGAVLLCYGLGRLLFSPGMRPYRFLGVTCCVLALLFLTTGAREYYTVGMYPVLFAAGAVGLQQRRQRVGRPRWSRAAWPVYLLSAALCLPSLTPWPLPVFPGQLANNTGRQWAGLTRDVASELDTLPENKRRHTVVLASSYWTAGALHHFGPEYGLERVYSGSRGYGFFGRPPEDSEATLYVGGGRSSLSPFFAEVDSLGTTENGTRLWLAEGRTASWERIWPRLRGMGMRE
ncbi:ArnT family glycosyltransferase [Actinopolyspora mortivallis]|uniref:Glycosyl transferase n=1 Tax=Actinopolyspora mortivallis TaxID=33906 RepID=A0A2T0GV31_ACTMO|nr:glycosyltransferase family 39 protein [Actinopolyspora mortivallis]PRW62969.1 glycosyl transferase [Actinopolyspora mortivallis]